LKGPYLAALQGRMTSGGRQLCATGADRRTNLEMTESESLY